MGELVVMAPSRASTLGCLGRKMPQSTQRDPSSSDSRGGRSQTWPSAASWRADVWWSGHWSSKLCRRVANDMFDVGFILVFSTGRYTESRFIWKYDSFKMSRSIFRSYIDRLPRRIAALVTVKKTECLHVRIMKRCVMNLFGFPLKNAALRRRHRFP